MPEPVDILGVSELSTDELVGCHDCDLLMIRPHLAPGEKAQCPRCGYELYTHRRNVVQRSLALVVSALLLYIPANFLPIMNLNLLGIAAQDTVWSGVLGLFAHGMPSVAIVVFLCGMGIPLLKLLCQLAVLLTIQWNVARGYGLLLYRTYHHLRDWGMLEVYLIGVLVSIVKLHDVGELSLGAGLVCFVLFLLAQLRLEMVMTPHQIWDALSGDGLHASD